MPHLFLILALLSGFVACFAVGNLFSWARTHRDPSSGYFGLLSLGFSAYTLLQIFILSSRELATASTLLRVQGAVLAATLAVLVPFGATLTRRRMDWFDAIPLITYSGLALWSLASPTGYWFAALSSMEPQVVAGGVIYHPHGTIAWTYYVSIVVQFPLFLRQVLDGVRLMRAGATIDGGLWAVGMSLMLLGAAHDHCVDFGWLPAPYLAEYPFPLLMMAMGFRYAFRRDSDFVRVCNLQASLAESEAKLRDLFEGSHDAIVLHDVATGSILDVNRTMTEMYGYARAECLRLSVADLSAPTAEYSQARAIANIAAANAQGGVAFPWNGKRKDGSEFPVEVRLKRTTLADKLCIVANVRDISAQHAAAAALTESEERYRTLFESAGDAILLMLDGSFVDCNAHALRIFGCNAREQLIGHSPEEFSPELQPDGQASHNAASERVATATAGAPQHFEWLHRRVDGTTFPAEVSLNVVVLRSIPHLQAIVRDTSERTNLESRLRQAQRLEAIGHLAGGVAHDFNNLLTPILGHAELLMEGLNAEDSARLDLEQIRSAAVRAQRLTRQLLTFGRKALLKVVAIDLDALLGNMEPLLRGLLREDIELRLEPDGGRAIVMADPSHLEQVLMNLVVNARDAMPNGGTLTLDIGRCTLDAAFCAANQGCAPGRYAVISVTDTGLGIAPEVRAHLFEPFFTTKAIGEGTGLGLATVFGIVKQHRGALAVASEPGKGSKFSVFLPMAPSTSELPPGAVEKVETRGGKELVLVVEDDAAVRNFACRALELYGYRTRAAADPEEALALARSLTEVPDLVLADVVMPGMSGRELFDRLCQGKLAQRVLYMSGYSGDTVSHHGVLDAGVVLLQKPFAIAELLSKVRSILDAPVPLRRDTT